jgi:hypothetical protein
VFDWLNGPRLTLLGFGARWAPLIENCEVRCADALKGYVLARELGDPRHYMSMSRTTLARPLATRRSWLFVPTIRSGSRSRWLTPRP